MLKELASEKESFAGWSFVKIDSASAHRPIAVVLTASL